jgi:hypothetical protein
MPEIPYVRFSCGNSNIRDLLQILAKKTCPQNRLKNTRCKGVIERPDNRVSELRNVSEL